MIKKWNSHFYKLLSAATDIRYFLNNWNQSQLSCFSAGFKVQISRIRNHLDIWMNPSLHRSGKNIHVHGASGPRLRSTWCVSQMGSAGVSAPSSLGLVGAARFRKSCRILKETTTSASCSLWGITLMKKPSLLDFLKATMLKERACRLKTPPCWRESAWVLTYSGSSWKSWGSANSSYSAAASFPAKTSSLVGTIIY